MNNELLISTLRAMNLDGVNHVGYAADVIETMQQKLAAETKNKQQFERDWLECCDALSAAQAREKVLINHIKEAGSSQWWIDKAEELISQPTDDTAIRAALAAERERCAKVCDIWVLSDDAAKAIRALGDQ